MKTIAVPTKEQVSPANQTLFDNLTKAIGSVPNLYAVYAHSENALGTYLALSGAKTSLKAKERSSQFDCEPGKRLCILPCRTYSDI